METAYEKFNLKEVINASGKMTALGVSKYSNAAIEAQQFGGKHFFEMDQLSEHVGSYLANLLEVEDACVVSSASAGIAQSVAAVIGQGSSYHLHHPYSKKINKREIIIPKGHHVDYGASVGTMIELGGGKIVEAGYANKCDVGLMEEMISEQTAAILYVKSHHTVQKSMLSIKETIKIAHTYQLPVIVDAAAEEDLYLYTRMGADLVIYSGSKAISAPTSGLVIGKGGLVEWVRMQSNGIGRAMKIGKENILGLAAAVDCYLKPKSSETGEQMKARLHPFIEQLQSIPMMKASMSQDIAGRDIFRAKVEVESDSSCEARELFKKLKDGNPAIYSRDHQLNNGILEFDIRSINKDEMDTIIHRIQEIMNQ